jgi:hypothetical protein
MEEGTEKRVGGKREVKRGYDGGRKRKDGRMEEGREKRVGWRREGKRG